MRGIVISVVRLAHRLTVRAARRVEVPHTTAGSIGATGTRMPSD
ncbi:UNVERIFIED_CONTAM: hypothetical protein RKD50_001664 [Streptomyces canus]